MGADSKKISIKEIASALDISITTISFVLNGKAEKMRISKQKEEKILNYVKEIGYKPSPFARGLRTGKSAVIAVVVDSLSSPFYARLVQTIIQRAEESGYRVFCAVTGGNSDKARKCIHDFIERKVDGYIIANTEGMDKELLLLSRKNKPVVFLDEAMGDTAGAGRVSVDVEESVYTGIEFLYKCNYRNLALLTWKSTPVHTRKQLTGYQKAITAYHLSPLTKRFAVESSRQQVLRELKSFLQSHLELDAVIFADYSLGIIGLQAMKELKIQIPSDLAVLVLEDGEAFEIYRPGITTIRQPVEEISDEAVSMLMRSLLNKNSASRMVSFQAELILRESVRNVISGTALRNP